MKAPVNYSQSRYLNANDTESVSAKGPHVLVTNIGAFTHPSLAVPANGPGEAASKNGFKRATLIALTFNKAISPAAMEFPGPHHSWRIFGVRLPG